MTQENARSESSEIFVGRTIGGDFYTIFDYAGTLAASVEHSPDLFCPECYREGRELQLLRYVEGERRFVHQNVNRDCYKDDRCKGRDHFVVQQTSLAHLGNSDQYTEAEVEYSMRDNSYDCGAVLVDNHLDGIVVEVQHGCEGFLYRIGRKIKIAHQNNHGIYIVFSPVGKYREEFQRLLQRGMDSSSVVAGRYKQGQVELGTLIRPGEIDRSVFPTRFHRNKQLSDFRSLGHPAIS